MCGRNVQFRGGEQENFRVWLALPQIATADISGEDFEQTPASLEMNLPHHLVGVFRGRCDRHRPPQRADRLNETESVGERSDTPGMYQFHEPLLLVLGIDNSLPFGVRDTQCL